MRGRSCRILGALSSDRTTLIPRLPPDIPRKIRFRSAGRVYSLYSVPGGSSFHDDRATLMSALRPFDFFITRAASRSSSSSMRLGPRQDEYLSRTSAKPRRQGSRRKFTSLPPQLPTYKVTSVQYGRCCEHNLDGLAPRPLAFLPEKPYGCQWLPCYQLLPI